MQKIKDILQASILWRLLDKLADWMGGQWRKSCAVHAYLNPTGRDEGASRASIFATLFNLCQRGLSWLYAKLRLDKLLHDSVLTRMWMWTLLTVGLAPVLPTMVTAGLAMLCFCSLALALVRDRNRGLAYSPVNKYVLLYCGVFAVGTLASVAPRESLPVGLLTIFFTLFALVVVNAVDSRDKLEQMIRVMIFAAVAVCFYGLFQFVFRTGYQSQAWVDSSMFGGISFRMVSTFENPNMLAQYLLLTIPLAGAMLINDFGEKKKRWLWLGCCAVMCLCMILTFSRGGWLALLVAGVVFLVMVNPRLLVLAPFALILLYFVLPDTIIQRFTSIGNLADHSTSYRVSIWIGSLRMLADYWLCGIGPGDVAFNTVYPTYSYDEITTPHTHNLFLQLTSDAGICALVVFCVILWCFFRYLSAGVHKAADGKGRMLQIAFFSGMAGFLVQAMTDYSFYNYRVMLLFWVYLGLGMMAARHCSGKGADET